MKGDSNRIIGIILIVVISFVYIKFFAPDVSELEAQAQAETADSSSVNIEAEQTEDVSEELIVENLPDSVLIAEKATTFGVLHLHL